MTCQPNPILKPELSPGLPRAGGHQVGKTTGAESSDSPFLQNEKARIDLHLSNFRSLFPRQPHEQLHREDCRVSRLQRVAGERGERGSLQTAFVFHTHLHAWFFLCVSRGSYHMWNYLHPHNHFPDLLLGHPRKRTITDEAANLKITGLGFLIIILFPLWEMSCTPSSVFFICRWFLLNCAIDPKMDRKPGSLSSVPEGVKASLDLWNSPGYTEALQSI